MYIVVIEYVFELEPFYVDTSRFMLEQLSRSESRGAILDLQKEQFRTDKAIQYK